MHVNLDAPVTLKQTTLTTPFLQAETLPEKVPLEEISGDAYILKKISGSAYISEENKDPSFVVEVRDTNKNPMPGVPVKFQIHNDSTLPTLTDDRIQFAVLEPEIALTDADGRARTTLRLQPLEGESGTIIIVAYVPEDINAQFPRNVGSIS